MEIMDAIYSCDSQQLNKLLKNGTNPNLTYLDISLLNWAILKGDNQLITVLLRYGAKVTDTEISVGSMKNNPDLLHKLLMSKRNEAFVIPNSVVEDRSINLVGINDPISHTPFILGDEIVLVKALHGPIIFENGRYFVFKHDPFISWYQTNPTNPVTREPVDPNSWHTFTYVNWY